MTDEAERLLEAALALPDDERAVLAAILTDSIGDGTPAAEIEAAWAAEAIRRLENIRSGKATTIPWEEVMSELLGNLAGSDPRGESG